MFRARNLRASVSSLLRVLLIVLGFGAVGASLTQVLPTSPSQSETAAFAIDVQSNAKAKSAEFAPPFRHSTFYTKTDNENRKKRSRTQLIDQRKGEPITKPEDENREARRKWLLFQRTYPFESLPQDARRKAWATRPRAQDLSQASPIAGSWRSIGPAPIVTTYSGADSGHINAIAVSPINPQIILIGAAAGGIWRSTDGGTTFVPVSDQHVDLGLGSIAFSKSNPQIVYAGMGDVYYGSFLGTGVLKSTDAGNTWTRVSNNTLPAPGTTSKIAVDPLNANRVYLAQHAAQASDGNIYSSGFFLSTDGGINWSQTLPGLAIDVAIHPGNPQVLYLTMSRVDRSGNPPAGLYKSVDGGNSWAFVTSGPFDSQSFPVFYLGTTPADPQYIYVSAAGSIGGVRTFRVLVSPDGGTTWTDRGPNNSLNPFPSRYIAVDPVSTSTVYIGQYDLLKSIDGGVSWTNLSANKIHIDQHSFTFAPSNSNIIYLGNDGGLSKSSNGGGTFESLNSSLSLVQFYGLTLHPTDPLLTYGGTQDNGTQRRLPSGVQWRAISGGDGGPCVLDHNDPNTVFVSYQLGGIWRLKNGGDTFDAVVATQQTFGESVNQRVAFIPPFTGNGVDSKLYFGTWRLFISANLGNTWSAPAGMLDLTKGGNDVLTTIGVGRSNSAYIYTGSAQGRAMVSIDGGISWTDITSGLPNRYITNIKVDPNNSAVAYLTVSGYRSGHVFKTTNAGSSWTNLSGNLPDIPTNALLIDPTNSNIIYVGTDIGVFRSTAGGVTWESFNNGMPPAPVFAFASQANGTVRLGTYGRGAYELIQAPTIQLSATTYSFGENAGTATISISRVGDTSASSTIEVRTSDSAGLNNCSFVNGAASARCDYTSAVTTLRLAAGETSKAISIPIVDDSYAEGNETFTVSLTNPISAVVGSLGSATITINDNETSNGPNPVDGTPFFVRQQYLDFLNREPDPAGNAAWQSVINNCPAGDTTCDRIHVSSAFFRSPEFQDRGYFVYRLYPVSFGRKPEYVEFVPDLAKVSGFLNDAELEAAKVAFITEFMSRSAFVTKFNGLNDTQYVDTLLATAQVTSPHRDFWIAALGNGTRTRPTVLRDISESSGVYNKYYNQAFVVMQYFGYLRRDPDAFYLDWIAVLDSSGDHRGMVNGFMNSLEYRFRFGP